LNTVPAANVEPEPMVLPLLDALKWSPVSNQYPVDERIFVNMASNSNSRLNLDGMGWNSMSLKIGRLPDVPLDGLSFANYHKAVREDLLMRSASYRGGINSTNGLLYDENGDVRTSIAELSLSDVIDMFFLNALQRKATTVEQTDLLAVYRSNNHLTTSPTGDDMIRTDRYDDVASITYDYISRLPEFYYFRAINQGGQ